MVRTRFAPSPTGFLHIGGVRTALFNWLYARRHGGKFVLRIDDTDRSRYRADSEAAIYRALRWLQIDWDEGPDKGGSYGPYRQSERIELYQRRTKELIARGSAYRCFCSPERCSHLHVNHLPHIKGSGSPLELSLKNLVRG